MILAHEIGLHKSHVRSQLFEEWACEWKRLSTVMHKSGYCRAKRTYHRHEHSHVAHGREAHNEEMVGFILIILILLVKNKGLSKGRCTSSSDGKPSCICVLLECRRVAGRWQARDRAANSIKLTLTLLSVLICSVGALHLLAHVVNLERENREAVDCPCRRLGVETCVGEHIHVAVLLTEIRVNLLNEVGTVD